MAVTVDSLMAIKVKDRAFSYTDRESMLYALGVGMGRDPLDSNELGFVYEGNGPGAGPKTVPTMSSVLTQFTELRDSGIDYAKVLHTDQRLTVHRPLPYAADIVADYGITGVVDKGAGKGIFIYTETCVSSAQDNESIYTVGGTIYARGDGGIGSSGMDALKPHQLPDRAPDHSVELVTRADQALLYRLNGDRNPLHSDPVMAKRGGFDQPILHGLCSYGVACRAVIASVCDYDSTKIKTFNVRFSSPVFPGETIVTDIWRDGNDISFRCRVPDRDIVAINNGHCILG